MYLKELELFGFKSFPQKTILKFEKGITAIVGPNGCGKSNILDAVKWALGEQSPKSLRSYKMEDVIFNGTENYPSLNYAEVILTFSNEDRYLPIDYNEVSICRRLYRSGESEYYINKNLVRLKDIEDLFMGTGVGEATYSFIDQGKIEVFLNYKPEEKRLIFDEASGIVKYKEKKKETLDKLQETEENLIRLEDIISEVARQIKYLERQVEKAKKFKETQEELILVEKKIATLKSKELNDKINFVLEELNNLKAKESQKQNICSAIKEDLEKLENSIADVKNQLKNIEQDILVFNSEILNLKNSISFSENRLKEIEERNSLLKSEKQSINDKISFLENKIEEENENFKKIDSDVLKIKNNIEDLTKEKEKLLDEIKDIEKEIETQKLNVLQEEDKNVKINNLIVKLDADILSFTNHKKRLLLDKAKLEELINSAKEDLKIKEDEVLKFKESLNIYKEKKENLSLKINEILNNKENIKNSILENEKKLIEINSYLEFLKDLSVKYEIFSERRKVEIIFYEEPKNINKLVASLENVDFKKQEDFYKASVEAKVISLKEEDLKNKIDFLNNTINELKSSLEILDKEYQEVNESLLKEDEKSKEDEKIILEKIQETENLKKNIQRLDEEFVLIDKELTKTIEDINLKESEKKKLIDQQNLCQENILKIKESLNNLQKNLSKDLELIKDIDIDIAKKDTEIKSLLREKETLNSKISILIDEKKSLTKTLSSLIEEENKNSSNKELILKNIEDAGLKIKDLENNISINLEKKQNLSKDENALFESINSKKSDLEKEEKERQEINNLIYNKKLEIQSYEHELENIKNYIKQVYSTDFSLIEDDKLDKSLDEYLESRDNLKKKLESLGEVNLIAIEEFEELKKRYDFLEKQKQDLIVSKENLKKAIQKINKTSKDIFLETFKKIEEEFNKNFRFLFGGGKSRLLLLDYENVLESGIEIEVQPPGKKLQNILLLSGGEKALTTIALIFAIFKVKPSPICILDEIDAPLDEANISRFNHLLSQFSKNSQFLVITHNKKTMSTANVLYGVTMQEKGVSKLVSVKFLENENIADKTNNEEEKIKETPNILDST